MDKKKRWVQTHRPVVRPGYDHDITPHERRSERPLSISEPKYDKALPLKQQRLAGRSWQMNVARRHARTSVGM